ncbi:MAG: hypothetical protein AB4368_00675 [Xenococcaceae cyanobacterium]
MGSVPLRIKIPRGLPASLADETSAGSHFYLPLATLSQPGSIELMQEV